MENDYLASVKKQFAYYKMLGDNTFAQLSDEQFFYQINEESNSIAECRFNLHLHRLVEPCEDECSSYERWKACGCGSSWRINHE